MATQTVYPRARGRSSAVTHRDPATALAQADDAELVRTIGARQDRAAFDELYRRYESVAFGLLLQIVHDHALAEDALQEAFLSIWRFAATYRVEQRVARAWLLRIVANEGLRLLRARRRKEYVVPASGGDALADAPAKPNAGPEREVLLALHAQIALLEPEVRRVVALYYMAGLSQSEIGEALNLTQQAISARIRDGLEHLQRGLSRTGFAAALPLLDAPNWASLIPPAPAPGAGAKAALDARLDTATQAAEASQRIAAFAGAKTTVAGAIAAAVLAAGAGVWYLSSENREQPANAEAEPAGAVAAPARVLYHQRFEFTAPAPDNVFKVLAGAWHFTSDDGLPGSGGMDTEGATTQLQLDLPPLRAPLCIRIRAQVLDKTKPEDGFLLSLGYSALEAGAFFRNTANPYHQVQNSADPWIDYVFYATPELVDCYVKDQRRLLLYLRPSPGAEFELFCRGHYRIRSVEVEEIEDIEAAKTAEHADFLAAIEAIPLEQRQGKHPLPARFKAAGRASPYIEFYPHSEPEPHGETPP